MEHQKPRFLSAVLDEIKGTAVDHDRISIGQLNDGFHERGFGILLFIFALPMALPLPVPPGINVLLASPLLLLTFQQTIGRRKTWLPDFVSKREFNSASLTKVIDGALPWVQRLECLLRPRLAWVTSGLMSLVIGLSGFIMALSICVPIPLTNTVPSFGIAMMAAGVLARDGFAVLFGMCIGLIWVSMLVLLGQAGFEALLQSIG